MAKEAALYTPEELAARSGARHVSTITKRELFAVMALQGLMASRFFTPIDHVAEKAVEAADALLLALETVKP